MIPLPRTVRMGSHGPDVDGHARALHRYLEDGQLGSHAKARRRVRETFGVGKRTLARKAARKAGLPEYGVIGPQLYDKLRAAGAYDAYADSMLEQYVGSLEPPVEARARRVREQITGFCLLAEANEDRWHYSQARPVEVLVDPSASSVWSDCSGYVIQAYAYAGRRTGLPVPDPSKQGYSGYGNTWMYLDKHPRVTDGLYQVGDLAHYYGHVTLCRRSGSSATSVWSSHGSEAGPIPLSLHYRHDLRFVVRPPF